MIDSAVERSGQESDLGGSGDEFFFFFVDKFLLNDGFVLIK